MFSHVDSIASNPFWELFFRNDSVAVVIHFREEIFQVYFFVSVKKSELLKEELQVEEILHQNFRELPAQLVHVLSAVVGVKEVKQAS